MIEVVTIYISSGNVCESLFSLLLANKVLFRLLEAIPAGAVGIPCWVCHLPWHPASFVGGSLARVSLLEIFPHLFGLHCIGLLRSVYLRAV